MTSPGNYPPPDPELLAAYLDGEFEGRDGLDDLRGKVESWLESDPAAQELARDYRHLRRLCTDLSAPEVSPAVWARMLNRVRDRAMHSARSAPARRKTGVLPLKAALSALAAGLVVLFLSWYTTPPAPQAPARPNPEPHAAASQAQEEDFIFPVARADEVTILQVEGNDIATLVVGRLPLQGLLELVTQEEVSITSMEPAEDNMVPEIFVGTRGPMIWARAPSD